MGDVPETMSLVYRVYDNYFNICQSNLSINTANLNEPITHHLPTNLNDTLILLSDAKVMQRADDVISDRGKLNLEL